MKGTGRTDVANEINGTGRTDGAGRIGGTDEKYETSGT